MLFTSFENVFGNAFHYFIYFICSDVAKVAIIHKLAIKKI